MTLRNKPTSGASGIPEQCGFFVTGVAFVPNNEQVFEFRENRLFDQPPNVSILVQRWGTYNLPQENII
jgi:hypothetical protein